MKSGGRTKPRRPLIQQELRPSGLVPTIGDVLRRLREVEMAPRVGGTVTRVIAGPSGGGGGGAAAHTHPEADIVPDNLLARVAQPETWAALQTFAAGLQLAAGQAIKDSGGADRITLNTASPQVQFTGNLQTLVANAGIYNSAGTVMMRFQPLGVGLIPRLGVNAVPSAGARFLIAENATLDAVAALMQFNLGSSQSANIVMPQGVMALYMQGLHDLSGYTLTRLAPVAIFNDITDTIGGGVLAEYAGIYMNPSGGTPGLAATSTGLDIVTIPAPTGLAVGVRQRQAVVGAVTAENRFAARTIIGADAAPAASATLELQSTTGAMLITRLTTGERDTLTPSDGMIIYNTTVGSFQKRVGGAWANF